jgi:hypothetical protein
MAELPVKAAAKNLITAIARLPTIAATIAVVDFEVDDSFSISFTPLLMMKFGEFDQMNVTSSPENVLAPIGTGDDKVDQNQHQIVMPSGRLLSPKTSMPNKDLPLDRSQHDQNQTNRCELREYTKRDSQTTGDLRDTEKYRKRRRHTDTLGPLLRNFNGSSRWSQTPPLPSVAAAAS